jgi:hypothetical protein
MHSDSLKAERGLTMRSLNIIALCACLFSISALKPGVSAPARKAAHAETEAQAASAHHGTLTAVTTRNMWISDNNKNNQWVIDVEGKPEKKYVVDSPAREEISHYETVYHEAITHEEPVYSTRSYWVVSFPVSYAVFPDETYYDYAQALAAAGERDGNITEHTEQYVSSYTTVTDKAAYSETVKVIDQYAKKEEGHYETEIVGEIGHWEQGKKENIGKGNGKYISKMIREDGKGK